MTTFRILFLLFCSLDLFAQEIKVKGILEKKLELVEKQVHSPSIYDKSVLNKINLDLYQVLFPVTDYKNQITTDKKFSGIFDFIINELAPAYQKIGENISGEILNSRKDFDLGVTNAQGMQWQKPFGFFKIIAERNIDERNFGKHKWVATDNFILEIDAKNFLEKLLKLDFLKDSSGLLEAFAGVKFYKRFVLKHNHHSYEEALKSNFKNLFLPFTLVQNFEADRFEDDDSWEHFENLSMHAGGNINYTWNALEFGLGGSIELESLKSIKLTKEDDLLDINVSKLNSKTTKIDSSLKASFLSLIKLTLFEYGFYNTIMEGFEKTYRFTPAETQNIGKGLFTDLLLSAKISKDDAVIIGKNLISYKKISEQEKTQNGSFLVWKKQKRYSSKLSTVSKYGIQKDFIRKVSVIEKKKVNFWSLFSFKGLKLENINKLQRSEVVIDYQKDDNKNFSVKLTQLIREKIRKHVPKGIFKDQTPFYYLTENFRASEYVEVKHEINIDHQEILKILKEPKSHSNIRIEKICENKAKKIKRCIRKLKRRMKRLKRRFSMNELNAFFKEVIRQIPSYKYYKSSFGINAVQVEGKLKTVLENKPFQTFFFEGNFQESDVIERFFRYEN